MCGKGIIIVDTVNIQFILYANCKSSVSTLLQYIKVDLCSGDYNESDNYTTTYA